MIHEIIDILSHASLFLIFLTVFYVTYVGYIQERSMVHEFGGLLSQSLQTLGLILPPSFLTLINDVLKASPAFIRPTLDTLVQHETDANKKVLSPLFLGVLIASVIALSLSLFLAYLSGYSILRLLMENLIALSFIAITDVLITTLYGNFRTLDSQYLLGIFAQKGSGAPLQCNVVEDTLDKMFPIPFIQKIIHALLPQGSSM